MKKTIIATLLTAVTATGWSQQAQHTEMKYVATTAQLCLSNIDKKGALTLEVTNLNSTDRKDAPVCVQLPQGHKWKSATVYADGVEIPSQLDDLNGDG